MSIKELKTLPLREFCKYLNKYNSKGAMSDEYDGWGSTSQPSSNNFCQYSTDMKSSIILMEYDALSIS